MSHSSTIAHTPPHTLPQLSDTPSRITPLLLRQTCQLAGPGRGASFSCLQTQMWKLSLRCNPEYLLCLYYAFITLEGQTYSLHLVFGHQHTFWKIFLWNYICFAYMIKRRSHCTECIKEGVEWCAMNVGNAQLCQTFLGSCSWVSRPAWHDRVKQRLPILIAAEVAIVVGWKCTRWRGRWRGSSWHEQAQASPDSVQVHSFLPDLMKEATLLL